MEIFPMKHLDPKALDRAFVRPGTPMLADVIRHLGNTPDLLGTRTRDMISGCRRIRVGSSPGSPGSSRPRSA
jgi:hypothetical protein